MSTFKKYEIGENYKVVLDLGIHLAKTHLSKQIEKIVFDLDTSKLESKYSSIGQNALHPKLMLSVIFYGYTQGIRTGRKLATACEENLAFIYLSKSYAPKKSAINDFRKDNYVHFFDLFLQVLNKCIEAGLADPSTSIVDGSKLESNSAKGRTKTQEKYEQWQEYLLQDIASLEKLQQAAKAIEEKKN
jgi:transposase